LTARTYWRDVWNLYVRYLVVGLCFIPAGLAYGFLQLRGWAAPWNAAFLLALSFALAFWFWRKPERAAAAEDRLAGEAVRALMSSQDAAKLDRWLAAVIATDVTAHIKLTLEEGWIYTAAASDRATAPQKSSSLTADLLSFYLIEQGLLQEHKPRQPIQRAQEQTRQQQRQQPPFVFGRRAAECA
jgi:hypothetical protein